MLLLKGKQESPLFSDGDGHRSLVLKCAFFYAVFKWEFEWHEFQQNYVPDLFILPPSDSCNFASKRCAPASIRLVDNAQFQFGKYVNLQGQSFLGVLIFSSLSLV